MNIAKNNLKNSMEEKRKMFNYFWFQINNPAMSKQIINKLPQSSELQFLSFVLNVYYMFVATNCLNQFCTLTLLSLSLSSKSNLIIFKFNCEKFLPIKWVHSKIRLKSFQNFFLNDFNVWIILQ